MIKIENGKHVLYSKDGSKKLGEFDTEEEAMAREKEIMKMAHAAEMMHPDSLEGRAAMVRDAWREKSAGMMGMDSPYVEEIFGDYAIICQGLKHFRVPYSMDGGKISFGQPEEVKVEYAEVSEPVATEAMKPTGKKWDICVIREGVSGHGWIYTRKALESLLPFLEGAKIRAVKTISGVFGHNGTLLGEIGTLSNARALESGDFVEARAEAEIKEERREWLLKAMESGEVNGVSINAPCEVTKFKNGSIWVKKFTGFIGLDLATIPSAGGVFLRATEAEEGDFMNREKILELLKKKRPDLHAKLAADCTIEQAQEALEQALTDDGRQTTEDGHRSPVSGQLTAQEAQGLRALKEQVEKDSCDAYLTRQLAGSKLPEPVKKKIEKQFAGSVFAREALDSFITAEKEMLDELAKSGHVLGAGEGRVEVAREAVDKLQAGMDKMFGVKTPAEMKDIPRFKGLLHAYKRITGEEFHGRFSVRGAAPSADHPAIAQEAIVSADFPSLLARTMNRRAVQDYNEFDYQESRLISSRGTATDFKTQEAINVGYYADPPIVDPESGDYLEAAKPGEQSVTYAIQIRGELVKISEITMRNDDLGTLVKRIKGRMRAYRRGFAKFVWNFYLDNATYDGDATGWFTVGHGNLKTEVLAAAEIADGVTKLMAFKELRSGEKIGLDPLMKKRIVLVVPDGMWDDARKINQRQYLDAAFDPNPVYHLFGDDDERIVVNPLETDANNWGLLMDPRDREIVEVKFLDGREEPEMWIANTPNVGEMQIRDDIVFKDRFVYGGDLVDFRNAVKAVVA